MGREMNTVRTGEYIERSAFDGHNSVSPINNVRYEGVSSSGTDKGEEKKVDEEDGHFHAVTPVVNAGIAMTSMKTSV